MYEARVIIYDNITGLKPTALSLANYWLKSIGLTIFKDCDQKR